MADIVSLFKLVLWCFVLLPLISKASGLICNDDPKLIETEFTNSLPDTIYLYCPMIEAFVFGSNSIIAYDNHAQIVHCVNTSSIINAKIEAGDQYYSSLKEGIQSTVFVNRVEKNLYLASIMVEYRTAMVYLNTFRFVFLDEKFHPRLDLPDIAFDPTDEFGLIFEPGFGNFPTAQSSHDCLLLSDGIHAITLITEIRDYTEQMQVHFPENKHQVAAGATGLVIINKVTGKQVASFSAYDFFIDGNDLLSYLIQVNIDALNDGFVTFGAIMLDITHTNSIVEVPGEHWSEELRNKRTFLISHKSLVTVDLIIWDFEEGKKPEFVWRWPGMAAPPAISQEWLPKWIVTGDPLFGTSETHDANVYNLPAGHMLVFDNGIDHKLLSNDGYICGMSRAVEYKITILEGGLYQANLVFSYPPLSEYPQVADPNTERSIKGIYGEGQCNNFWYFNVYMAYFGSARRLISGDTVLTWYGLFNMDANSVLVYKTGHRDDPSGTNMLVAAPDGTVRGAWNNTVQGHIAYRILPIAREEFYDLPQGLEPFKRSNIII